MNDADTRGRVLTSIRVLGHPFAPTEKRPVDEGSHYEVVAYTDHAGASVPTVIEWADGTMDLFTDEGESFQLRGRARAVVSR